MYTVMLMISNLTNRLHMIAIPLRSIATSEPWHWPYCKVDHWNDGIDI